MTATRALIKSGKTPVTLIAGFLIDGIEGAYNLHVKRQTKRSLEAT